MSRGGFDGGGRAEVEGPEGGVQGVAGPIAEHPAAEVPPAAPADGGDRLVVIAAFGGAAFGWLGDRIGRVKAMSLSILFYSVFSGVCYFATDPLHLAGARFLSALGMGGEWALGVALVMEAWPERHRSKMAAAIGMAQIDMSDAAAQ